MSQACFLPSAPATLALPAPLWLQRFTFIPPCLSLSVAQTHKHTHTSEHHRLTVWHASCAEGSTADKATPAPPPYHHRKLISGLQSRTVHRGLSPQSCYAWAGQLSHWSAFPHSPSWAFSLVCYALASPLWKTSPMGEVEEILKNDRTLSPRNKLWFQPATAGYAQWCHLIEWKSYACYAGRIDWGFAYGAVHNEVKEANLALMLGHALMWVGVCENMYCTYVKACILPHVTPKLPNV